MNDAAPQMVTQERAGPIDKSVLLFSGGMDSLCYAHLLKPDLLLYIPTGARYELTESWWSANYCSSTCCPTHASS